MGEAIITRRGGGGTKLTLDPVFANNSWYEIIEACRNKAVPDTWAVGDKKNMIIGADIHEVQIIGKNHDDYADGSGKAPLTFDTVKLLKGTYKISNTSGYTGGWTDSDMRLTNLPNVLATMPPEVQRGIREVVKPTGAGNRSTDIVTTADKLFLLSLVEMYGNSTYGTFAYTAEGEGVQYERYVGGLSKQHKYVLGNESANTLSFWLRSPVTNKDSCFAQKQCGYEYGNTTVGSSRYISPAFCF